MPVLVLFDADYADEHWPALPHCAECGRPFYPDCGVEHNDDFYRAAFCGLECRDDWRSMMGLPLTLELLDNGQSLTAP